MSREAHKCSASQYIEQMLCPLCAEPMLQVAVTDDKRHLQMLGCPCCRNNICQGCLYRHIRTVWENESTNNGTSQLTCPLGCGRDISDTEIRSCLQRQHAEIAWRWMGCEMLKCFEWFQGYSDSPSRSRKLLLRLFDLTSFSLVWFGHKMLQFLVWVGWSQQASQKLGMFLGFVFMLFYTVVFCWIWAMYQVMRCSPFIRCLEDNGPWLSSPQQLYVS